MEDDDDDNNDDDNGNVSKFYATCTNDTNILKGEGESGNGGENDDMLLR